MAGRPTKYKPEVNKKVIAIMKEGGSIVEVCAELDISRETLYDWINPESPRYIKEFSDTIKKGRILCQAWWEKAGRTSLVTPKDLKFNVGLWIYNMKLRFREDWFMDESGIRGEEEKVEMPGLVIKMNDNGTKTKVQTNQGPEKGKVKAS